MSKPIPEGSTVIATVFRPDPEMGGVGMRRFTAQSSLGGDAVAKALAARLPEMFEEAQLPELLLPGPPLVMLLQVILPDGQLVSFPAAAVFNRAAARADMLAAWMRDLPNLTATVAEVVRRALASKGTDEVKSPSSVMVH